MEVSIDAKKIETQKKLDSIAEEMGYHVSKALVEAFKMMLDAEPDRDPEEVLLETRNLLIGAIPKAMEKGLEDVITDDMFDDL